MAEFDISVTMTGIDELSKKLQSISYDMAKKGGRFALRKAAQVIVKAAQQKAHQIDDPATARNIATNIVERWNGRLNKLSGDLGFRIGVKGGSRFSGKGRPVADAAGAPTPEWRAVEFGTETTPAQAFFVPAFKANLQAATDTFIFQYGAALDRAIKKAAKL